MKKILYVVVAAVAMLATFVSCKTPEEEKTPVILTATDEGIEMELEIPAGVSNVEIVRKDLQSNIEHVCCNINYNPEVSPGVTKVFTDYFVEPNITYEYKVKYIRNWDWNNPEYVLVKVDNGNGGLGLLTTFKTKPTYNSESKVFEGMVLNNISVEGFSAFFTVNACNNDNGIWLIDDGGINIRNLCDAPFTGTYFDITKLHSNLASGIDGYTIRVIPVINYYDGKAWINYSGITSYYKDGTWR